MSGIWPGDTQCVVMLTFDVDGVSSWLRRNPDFAKLPSLMSMAEYGPRVATGRILDMLDELSIKSSFFVPGYVAENYPRLVEEITRRGHEVGHHGYMHEPPATMDPEEEEEILDKGIRILEGIVGEKPVGYRAPSLEASQLTLGLLASRRFTYDTSLLGDDAPYLVETSQGNVVEIPSSWILDDAPHFVHAPAAQRTSPMKSPNELYDIWAAEFEGIYKYGGSCNLCMHPQYIGHPGRLVMLERLVGYMRSFPNVSFMRMIDTAKMWSGDKNA